MIRGRVNTSLVFSIKVVIFTIYSISFAACRGYSLRSVDNPLINDGIYSISVPMFINQSSLPNVSSIFTREFFNIFHEFTGLKIYSGESSYADAVLVGIIKSPKRNKDIFGRENVRFTDSDLSRSLGDRPNFFVPVSTSYRIAVQLVLIKNPTFRELELLRSSLGTYVREETKVVFNHTFNVQPTFSRYVKDTSSEDSPGIVNSTVTKHFFEKNLKETARNTANNFKELFLNVF